MDVHNEQLVWWNGGLEQGSF